MGAPSIHDSLLTGYEVDGKGRRIVLHTEPHQGGGEVRIDIEFHGVVAYHFEGDLFQNIVFGVDEVEAEKIIGDGAAFAERELQYGWPRGWDSRTETAAEYFAREGVRVFELECSYGMAGWVAAKSMTQTVKP